jgi:hypothetical protein
MPQRLPVKKYDLAYTVSQEGRCLVKRFCETINVARSRQYEKLHEKQKLCGDTAERQLDAEIRIRFDYRSFSSTSITRIGLKKVIDGVRM